MTTAVLIFLIMLILEVAYGTAQLRTLGDKLGSLEELLAAEFNKVKNYDREVDRWVEHARGDPPDISPPTPPAIIRVVDMLRSINENTYRLAKAMDKLAGEEKTGQLPRHTN